VTVFVSTGTSVPNLVGLPRSQADANLRAAGLKGSYTPQSVSDASQNGMVISQSVPAGTALPPGSTVDVVVGAYAATTTTPPSTTSPTPTG
ncbi:MAG: PASTA domain-containing protein, partial [Acidimicrobiales bacterium]